MTLVKHLWIKSQMNQVKLMVAIFCLRSLLSRALLHLRQFKHCWTLASSFDIFSEHLQPFCCFCSQVHKLHLPACTATQFKRQVDDTHIHSIAINKVFTWTEGGTLSNQQQEQPQPSFTSVVQSALLWSFSLRSGVVRPGQAKHSTLPTLTSANIISLSRRDRLAFNRSCCCCCCCCGVPWLLATVANCNSFNSCRCCWCLDWLAAYCYHYTDHRWNV